MDVLIALWQGILIALEPINLGLAVIGVVVGLFVGAMPGLGSVNGVAILLPFTFVIQSFTGGATSPMIFLASIYYGAMYGGAISSITLGIPGASTAVATTFDGRPLALAGRAHVALVVAALASFAGATVSNLLFTGFADGGTRNSCFSSSFDQRSHFYAASIDVIFRPRGPCFCIGDLRH